MSRRSHAQPLLLFGAHVVEVPAIHRPFPIVYPVPAHTVSRDIVRLIDVIRRACADRGRDGLPAGIALALDGNALEPCRLDVCSNRRREIRAIQRLVAFATVHSTAAHVSVRADRRGLFFRGILQNGADKGGLACISVPTFIPAPLYHVEPEAPVEPCGITKSNMALSAVPTFVTLASVPGAPVSTVPIAISPAAPCAP